MTARIAIVTTLDLEVPDADEQLLLPHLPEGELVAWDDPSVDWSSYEVAVLRSTWNYTERIGEFREWLVKASALTRLVNPLETIVWNTDKRYLDDLAARGIPVVPTIFVVAGDEVAADAVAGSVVVKPSVGAGSAGAALFHDDPDAAVAHVNKLHADGRVAMIQPYLSQVDEAGETALIYLNGRYSHAAKKAAILSRGMSWSTGLYADEKITPYDPTEAERDLADRVVAGLPEGLAYARIDLLPSEDGPVLLELELTEPSLFLGMDPDAPARAAATFRALLG